jgi:uncharacterized membrane protein
MTSSHLRLIYLIAAAISLVGLGEATYLTMLHLTGETAVCGGSAGCFEVLGSSYARVAGLPLAGFGAVAYFIAFSCATFAAFGYTAARKFFAVTVMSMFLVSLWLLYVQAFLLHAFCQYCLFSAAMIFFLTGLAIVTPWSEGRNSTR